MKIKDFKAHNVVRSSPPPKENYKDYKADLRRDFCNRCAYCNLSQDTITTPFEVDHLVPRKAFKGKRESLDADYRNLIYSCKKCNVAKSSKFAGDIYADPPENDLFYNPAVVDYNTIFYRNEFGAIESDDEKGKKMIQYLKLYRPIHILGWLREEINSVADQLQQAVACETDPDRKKEFSDALAKMDSQYRKYNNILMAAYNDNSFSFSEI